MSRFAILLAAALFAGCHHDVGPAPTNTVPAPTAPVVTAETGGAWSAPVDGVRARLVAVKMPADATGKPQVRIDLEIENVGDVGNPIEIWWDTFDAQLKFSLETETGPAEETGLAGSFAAPPPYWLELPVDSAMRFTITKNAFEYVPNGPTMFRPTTFQGWEVKAGVKSLVVGGTFKAAQNAPTTGDHRMSWTGTIELPKLALPR